MICSIRNKSKESLIAKKAKVADNFFLRLAGLMFRKSIDYDTALIFYHAPSIHTFFMRFPIDVVFLDKDMRVVKVVLALKPARIVFCPKAAVTIELAPYKTSKNPIETGDILELSS
jgi:hypothetical protein